MGVGKGPGPPWIFKHCTNIVNKGLKVLFFGLFFRCHPSLEDANSAIFGIFLLIFGLFPVFSVAHPP